MGSRYQGGDDPFTRAEEGRGRGPPESHRTPPRRSSSQRDQDRGELFESQRSRNTERNTERSSRSGSGREGRESSRERGQAHRSSSRSHLASAGSSTAEVAGATGSRRSSTAEVAGATGSRRSSTAEGAGATGSRRSSTPEVAGVTGSRRTGAAGARVGHVPRNEQSDFDEAPLPPPPGKRPPPPPSPSEIGGGASADYVALPGATLSRGNSKVVSSPPMAAAVAHAAPKARCMSRCSFRILAVLLLVLILVPVGVLLFVKSKNDQNNKNGKSNGDADAAHGAGGDPHPPPPPAPRPGLGTNSTTGSPPTPLGANASAPSVSSPGMAPSPWLGEPTGAPGPGTADAPSTPPSAAGKPTMAPGPDAGGLAPGPEGALAPGPLAGAPNPSSFNIIVDLNGPADPANGLYNDLSLALLAVTDGAGYMNDTKVLIKAGFYYGQFKLYDRNYVTLVGDPTGETKLSFDKCSDCLNPADLVSTAPLQIRGQSSYITLVNLVFENAYGWPRVINGKGIGQALAIFIASNRTQVYNCKFFGYQDTVGVDGFDTYFKDSLIFGSVDYVFGKGKALLDNVTLLAAGCDPSVACTNDFCCENVVTAPSAPVETVDPQLISGFVFINSVLRVAFNNTASRPLVELGRAWGRSAFAAFVKCTLPPELSPLVWGVPTFDASITYQGSKVLFELFGNTVPTPLYSVGPNPSIPPITYLTEVDVATYLDLTWISGPEWLYTPGPFQYPV